MSISTMIILRNAYQVFNVLQHSDFSNFIEILDFLLILGSFLQMLLAGLKYL